MSILTDVQALITVAPAYLGYAATGAALPYVVARPLLITNGTDRAVSGDPVAVDSQLSLYCCAASVEACFNLAVEVMQELDAARVSGTMLATSMGYSGAPVEGHYESQVTVQLNQGGF